MKKMVIALFLLANSAFANEVGDLRRISEILNSYTPNFYKNIQTSLNKEIPLHGRQLRLMHEIVSHFLKLDKKFTSLINKNEFHLIKVLLELDRRQSFIANFKPYYSTTRLRRYLNDEDLSFSIKKNELNSTIMNLLDIKKAALLKSRVDKILRSNNRDIYTHLIKNHKALPFISNIKEIKELVSLYESYKKKDRRADRIVDLTDRISGRFGNTAGAIRWRKGHL